MTNEHTMHSDTNKTDRRGKTDLNPQGREDLGTVETNGAIQKGKTGSVINDK